MSKSMIDANKDTTIDINQSLDGWTAPRAGTLRKVRLASHGQSHDVEMETEGCWRVNVGARVTIRLPVVTVPGNGDPLPKRRELQIGGEVVDSNWPDDPSDVGLKYTPDAEVQSRRG